MKRLFLLSSCCKVMSKKISMYKHLTIFKFQSNVPSEKQVELVNQLLAFKDKIPDIIDLSADVNSIEETQHIYSRHESDL